MQSVHPWSFGDAVFVVLTQNMFLILSGVNDEGHLQLKVWVAHLHLQAQSLRLERSPLTVCLQTHDQMLL